MKRFVELLRPFVIQKTTSTTLEDFSVVAKWQQQAKERFSPLVMERGLILWSAAADADCIGGRIVIGAATWSSVDMRLLDELADTVSAGRAGDDRIEVFHFDENANAAATQADLDGRIPGLKLSSIFEPPIVGWWQDGAHRRSLWGFEAVRFLIERYRLSMNLAAR